jgi:hypothetical protein
MGQLVGEQALPGRGARSVGAGREPDVAAPSERERLDASSGDRRPRVVVHPHARQVHAGAGLEEPTVGLVQPLPAAQEEVRRDGSRRTAGGLAPDRVATPWRPTMAGLTWALGTAARRRPRGQHRPGQVIRRAFHRVVGRTDHGAVGPPAYQARGQLPGERPGLRAGWRFGDRLRRRPRTPLEGRARGTGAHRPGMTHTRQGVVTGSPQRHRERLRRRQGRPGSAVGTLQQAEVALLGLAGQAELAAAEKDDDAEQQQAGGGTARWTQSAPATKRAKPPARGSASVPPSLGWATMRKQRSPTSWGSGRRRSPNGVAGLCVNGWMG